MADSTIKWSIRDKREPVSSGSIMMDGWELKMDIPQGTLVDGLDGSGPATACLRLD